MNSERAKCCCYAHMLSHFLLLNTTFALLKHSIREKIYICMYIYLYIYIYANLLVYQKHRIKRV